MYFEYYILLALLPLLVSSKYRGGCAFLCILLGAVISGCGAISTIAGLSSPIYIPSMDRSATVFSLLFSLIFLTILPSVRVGLAHAECRGSANALHWSVIVVLYYALQGVLMAQSAFGFLFYWELMSVALFVLVAFGSSRREVMHAAVSLFVVMHAAFFVLLGAFMALPTADVFFAKGSVSIALWILFFVAFMVKSAVFPLHFWLPRTYIASPPWVSALMGGAVTNMGVYGIIRIMGAVDDLYSASLCLMVVGAVSALYGAMRLPASRSLSKLLSYSSIDNIGLILLALGLGFYGKAVGNEQFAMWGFVGGAMQLVLHAVAKALLFLSVGSVGRALGDDTTSVLGGLVRSMPGVALAFALGAMSLMAIVPMGGFWSEFAIFSSIFTAIGSGAEPVVGVVALVVVSLCAAATIFSFSKSFAVAFLGVARTQNTESTPCHSSLGERVSIGVLSLVLLFGGGFLMWGFSLYGHSVFGMNNPSIFSSATSIAYSVALVCGIFVGVVALLWFLRRMLLRGRIQREEPTWSCADGPTEPEMQYTDESFAAEASQLFSSSLDTRDNATKITRKFVPARVMRRLTGRLALLHTGRTSHYIMHIILFLALILLLTLTKVI